MSVLAPSAEEPDENEDQPDKPKRVLILRSKEQWAMIRARYETCPDRKGIRKLAAELGISPSTITKRAWKEGWKQSKGLVTDARKAVEAAIENALPAAALQAAENAAASIVDRLQPIIEREKARHIEQQIGRSNGHLSRLDSFLQRKRPMEPKDEAYLAKAVSSHVMDLRKTLGMSDSGGFSGNLSVNILAGQAAVSVSQS